MYFPLGILYLASSVEKAGYSVEVADLRDGGAEIPEAKFYGFSCTTPEIEYAKAIASKLKGKTIVGGAHPSLCLKDCNGYFDYVVRGEGENVLPKILSGEMHTGIIQSSRIKDLDSIPFPAWDKLKDPFSKTLFPGERYGKGYIAATVIASRGCPYSCSFCGNVYRAPVVFRSVGNICAEIKELMKREVNYFRFEDDNFTLHPKFRQLCNALKKLDIHYKCHTRSDLMTSGQASMLKKSGCEECGLGVESADDRVLKLNNKRESSMYHIRAVNILKKHDIRVKTYFIAGLPGEDKNTLLLNKKFFEFVKPDKWTLSTFTPYPGCPVYKHPDRYGIEITNKDWTKWWNFCQDSYNHVIIG